MGPFFLWPPASSLVLLQLSEGCVEGKDSTTVPEYWVILSVTFLEDLRVVGQETSGSSVAYCDAARSD